MRTCILYLDLNYGHAREFVTLSIIFWTTHILCTIYLAFFCFTSYFANLGAVSNNLNDSDQHGILGKRNHELTDAIL